MRLYVITASLALAAGASPLPSPDSATAEAAAPAAYCNDSTTPAFVIKSCTSALDASFTNLCTIEPGPEEGWQIYTCTRPKGRPGPADPHCNTTYWPNDHQTVHYCTPDFNTSRTDIQKQLHGCEKSDKDGWVEFACSDEAA